MDSCIFDEGERGDRTLARKSYLRVHHTRADRDGRDLRFLLRESPVQSMRQCRLKTTISNAPA